MPRELKPFEELSPAGKWLRLHPENRKGISISSKYIMQVEHCPVCGHKGALKLRTQNRGSRYLQVDHFVYRRGLKHWAYESCCFLKMIDPEEEQVLLRKSN